MLPGKGDAKVSRACLDVTSLKVRFRKREYSFQQNAARSNVGNSPALQACKIACEILLGEAIGLSYYRPDVDGASCTAAGLAA